MPIWTGRTPTVLLLTLSMATSCAIPADATLPTPPNAVESTAAVPETQPAATAAVAESHSAGGVLEAKLRPLLDAAAEQAGVGAAVAVITPHGTWAGGAGPADADSGRLVTAETTFAIGSITKTVVAALVLRLAEDGRIDIDRPIAEYLPPKIATRANGATVREVLGHRSGVGDYTDHTFREAVLDDAERTWSANEILEYAGPVSFVAGTSFQYSNTNYILLDVLIQTVSGRPTGEVMDELLLGPHNLARMTYQPTSAPASPVAVGQADTDGDGRLAAITGGGLLPTRALATAAGGAGGMASDAPTLARWARLLYGGDVLEPASLEAMLDFSETDGPRYGLGTGEIRYSDDLVGVGHDGGIPGFSSAVVHVPEADVTVALLFNGDLVPALRDPVGAARPFLEAVVEE